MHPCAISTFRFQHTAARRRLVVYGGSTFADEAFQHTAARRRLGRPLWRILPKTGFNTQPPEGGWLDARGNGQSIAVSTHSRPKAAGLNTCLPKWRVMFQHTAARRRLG